jgi:CelD/BcsL family acetyltransferase involved in cellulose biosynthesis
VARIVIAVRVSGVEDFEALGRRWRDLERRADCSFFQTWTWYGCLAAERFSDPVLVEATEDGRTVALALCNRVRRRFGPSDLFLGESGQAELDCPYIEQNGVLAEAGRVEDLTVACLRAVAPRYRLILSGIGEPALAAVRRAADLVCTVRTQLSPYALVRPAGGDYLLRRSANTRQQIRRSARLYERAGAIVTERAETVPGALRMLDEMADLHQAAWTARGQPGSFAISFFRRFHAALIAEGLPRGEVALLRVSCGDATIGVLHNFTFRSQMYAYQSGFDYGGGNAAAKPGLTCHHAAIGHAADQGIDMYDFLAGEDRYKFSLSDDAYPLHWVEAGPFRSLGLVRRRVRRAAAAILQPQWGRPAITVISVPEAV